MNSIRRPRRRPRVSSYSLRSFGWLVVREASFRVVYGAAPLGMQSYLRVKWCKPSTQYCRRVALLILRERARTELPR